MIGAIVASHSRSGSSASRMVLVLGVRCSSAAGRASSSAARSCSCWRCRLCRRRTGSASRASPTRARTTPVARSAPRCCCAKPSPRFVANPLTGVGAGQFKNYDPEGARGRGGKATTSSCRSRPSSGIFGLLRVLVPDRPRGSWQAATRDACSAGDGSCCRGGAGRARAGSRPCRFRPRTATLPRDTCGRDGGALAGWFVCALFASVAYNWTFYYLLALAVAPREILIDRLAARRCRRRARQAYLSPCGRHAHDAVLGAAVRGVRRLDTRSEPPVRTTPILVDARTPVNFTMVAPVVRAMAARPARRVLLHRQRGAARLRDDLPRSPGRRS